MIYQEPPPPLSPLRQAVSAARLADESTCIQGLLPLARMDDEASRRVTRLARRLVEQVRARRLSQGGIDAFMHEYDLTSREGVALMCLAEALLRIPDSATADRLIQDKLADADWARHLGHSHSLFVNATTWGLMLTGRVVKLEQQDMDPVGGLLGRLVARSGEPAIRLALRQAMRIIGRQFVMGRTIEDAVARSREGSNAASRYSFDMLGEAALTHEDAQRYYQSYGHAIAVLSRQHDPAQDLYTRPGLSVKLSALHPRYEFAQRSRVMKELLPRLTDLALQARRGGLSLTIDAEEAERLEPSLDVFEQLCRHDGLADWEGLGLAVQAYQKRALPVIRWLAELARSRGRPLAIRLVKGAYWDMEIKRAQERGLEGYPVFTRKVATDVSYLACAREILDAGEWFYPQFATHNARTVASIMEMAGTARFEFQRLHGMGEALYAALAEEAPGIPCRVYAPVGSHEALLPYLVRRLLENGANTSFVNRIVDESTPIERVIADPVREVERLHRLPHPRIPLPRKLYGDERLNASGIDLHDPLAVKELAGQMAAAMKATWHARPLVNGDAYEGEAMPVTDPANPERVVGEVIHSSAEAIQQALQGAAQAFVQWSMTDVEVRAACLERAADLLESHRAELLALCVREGGRTVPDALAEVREAVDYCRYYACTVRALMARPRLLAGPAGERNALSWSGRGVFACISPWNFPLAIFTGQVAAALVAGNSVVAKPAHQTPLVAAQVVRLLHEAGIPREVLHFLPGGGADVGMRLVEDERIAGVAFTGSTATARIINQALARRQGPIAALIAETGGMNAMIVDSSALPEQVVTDVVQSAFNSAGQRCSSLRALFLQREIAPRVLELLRGSMEELTLGDPALLSTDIGPLIDEAARAGLMKHIARMERSGRLLGETPLSGDLAQGVFLAPRAFEIDSLECLAGEVFGPVLHVITYASDRLDEVLASINATGYGLTLGIHSRIEEKARYIHERARVGNVYVNRNMIGAVVGVQPFGGEGLSGTGPKAGGPHYLHRFATERTLSMNLAAVGGDTGLLSL